MNYQPASSVFSIAANFIERFVAAIEKLRIGHPFEGTTDISSLINEPEAIRVSDWINQAVKNGARC